MKSILKKLSVVFFIYTAGLFILFSLCAFIIMKAGINVERFEIFSFTSIIILNCVALIYIRKASENKFIYMITLPLLLPVIVLIADVALGYGAGLRNVYILAATIIESLIIYLFKPIKISKKNNINKIRRNYEKNRR